MTRLLSEEIFLFDTKDLVDRIASFGYARSTKGPHARQTPNVHKNSFTNHEQNKVTIIKIPKPATKGHNFKRLEHQKAKYYK